MTWNHWDESPDYPVSDWKQEVASDSTRLGYWDWIDYKQELEDQETQ